MNTECILCETSKIQRWVCLALLSALLCLAGCGGGGSSQNNNQNNGGPGQTSQPVNILFESNGALDGSDNESAVPFIWQVKSDGSGRAPFSTNPAGAISTPVWSPDGNHVAFGLNGSFAQDIWITDTKAQGATLLTSVPTTVAGDVTLAWSPNGAKLAFTAEFNATLNLFVVNADGSSLIQITQFVRSSDAPQALDPVWSPDSSRIAFASTGALDGSPGFSPHTNIWVATADGSSVVPLTTLTQADCSNPAWSPDGSKIAFGSDRALDGSNANNINFTSNIWVMNADGTNAVPLTNLTVPFTAEPVWSHSGKKIAYSSARAFDGSDSSAPSGASNIWVMNADGSGSTPVTRLTIALSFSPVWSPDDSKIAFVSSRALDGSDQTLSLNVCPLELQNRQSITNLWVINADGSGALPVTKLTFCLASSRGAAWQP